MLHPSTKRLIDKLSDMTRRQRVAWTEGENATVVHDTEGYRVVLTPEPHAVLLTDGVGREIEACLPEEFADELDAQGRPYTKFVAELYRDAHRHARGTEKAISTLLAGLEAVEEATPVWPVQDMGGAPPDPVTDETALIESETAITAAVATLADQINNGAPPAPEQEPEPEPALAQTAPPVEAAVTETATLPEPVASAAPEPAPMVAHIAPPAPPLAEPEPVPEVFEAAAEAPTPSVEVEPLAEEPGSFGTFGAFAPSSEAAVPDPAPEPAEAETEPAPLLAAEPAPQTEAEPEPEIEAPPAEVREPMPEPTLAAPTLAQPISLSSIPFGFGLGAAQRTGAPSRPAGGPSNAAADPKPDAPAPIIIDGTLDLPEDGMLALDETPDAEPFASQVPGSDLLDLPAEPPANLLDPNKPRRFNPWN